MTNAVNIAQSGSNNQTMRNRIINGAMTIDQRNAGASVTGSTSDPFVTDRWKTPASQNSKFTFQQNQGSVTPPVGFTNYLGATSSSAYSVVSGDLFGIDQRIEGFNIADLGWGTANAQPVTLSFWVRSSLTGTFGGSLLNSATNRSYVFTYAISAANTWEYKTVTIPGDTSGSWLTTNGIGIRLTFSLGMGSSLSGTAGSWSSNTYLSATGAVSVVGTNGATFYITGVQLEEGTAASPFENRLYGTELQLCYRYFQGLTYNSSIETDGMRIVLSGNGSTNPLTGWQFIVPMRAAPTMTSYGAGTAGGSYTVYSASSSSTQTNWSSLAVSFKGVRANYTGASGSSTYWVDCSTGGGGHGWTASAEL
jgi:hypothetical protein